MTLNHVYHFRKREGDDINICLCDDCFANKCFVYEMVIEQVQSNYLMFKAYVEHKRGNIDISYHLQEEARQVGQERMSDYALVDRIALNGVNDSEWNVIDELKKHLLSNNFQFKSLDTFEIQHMMRK